jgi:hypothetical protein
LPVESFQDKPSWIAEPRTAPMLKMVLHVKALRVSADQLEKHVVSFDGPENGKEATLLRFGRIGEENRSLSSP